MAELAPETSGGPTTDSWRGAPMVPETSGSPGAEGFDPTAFTGERGMPYVPPTWSDYGHVLAEQTSRIISGFQQAKAGQLAASGNDQQAWEADQSAQAWRQTAEDHSNAMSPSARDNLNTDIFSGKFAQHPWSSAMLKLTQQAPGAAALVGSTAAGAAVGQPLAGAFVGGGLMSWAGAADSIGDKVYNTNPYDLARESPQFAAMLKSGMSISDAQRKLIDDTLDTHVAAISGLIGGAASMLGPEAMPFTGAVMGTTGGIARRMLVGGVGMGLVGAGQDLGVNLALNLAAGNEGIGPVTSPGQMAESALSNFAVQGALGGLGSAFHRTGRPETNQRVAPTFAELAGAGEQQGATGEGTYPTPPMPSRLGIGTTTGQPDLTATGGEATHARTERNYRKPEAQKGAEQPAAGTGAPSTAQPTADDTSAALAAAQDQGPYGAGSRPPVAMPDRMPGAPTIDSGQTQPRVGEPPVVQPGTGQPRVETAQAGLGSPPTGLTGAPVSPPQPGAESQPAARPAPANGPETAQAQPTPESRATLELQQAAVVRGDRAAMVFPPNSKVIPLPEGGNLKVTKLPDGSTVHYNPDKTSYQGVHAAFRSNKLNELLGMGPVSKEEAIARAPTEGAAVVTERTPPKPGEELGTEVKAAAGTPETAPAQAAAFEANKAAPENQIAVEHPSVVTAKRVQDEIAARKAELGAAERGKFAPGVLGEEQKPPVQPTPAPRTFEPSQKPVYERVKELVTSGKSASTSYIQRTLKISYDDAHKVLQRLEKEGIVTAPNEAGRRMVIKPEEKAELPIVEPTARIIPKEEAEASQKERIEKQLAAAGVTSEAKIAQVSETGPKPGHLTAAQKATRTANNLAAEKIVSANKIGAQEPKAMLTEQQGGTGARNVVLNRLQNMLNEATAEKIKIPPEFNLMTDPAQDHSPAMVLLREAQRFLANKAPTTEDYKNYLMRETALRKAMKLTGDARREAYEDILRERISEGEEAKAAQGVGPRAGAKLPIVEKIASRTRKIEEETGVPKSDAQAEAGNYPHAHVTVEGQPVSVETAAGQTRRGFPIRQATHYGYILRTEGADGEHLDVHVNPANPHGTGKIYVLNQLDPETGAFDEHKVFLGYNDLGHMLDSYAQNFPSADDLIERMGGVREMTRKEFEDFKANGDLHQPVGEGVSGQQLGGEIETARGKFVPTARMTLREALDHVLNNLNQYDWEIRPFIKGMIKIIQSIVGEIPVYHMSAADMDRLEGRTADTYTGGYYSPPFNHIVLRDGETADGYIRNLIHEAVHAATEHSLLAKKGFYNATYKLMHHTMDLMQKDSLFTHTEVMKMYAFSGDNPSEFIAEAMSNPNFQRILGQLDISKDMAKELGFDTYRKISIWKGLIELVRNALNIPKHTVSALEAAMLVTEHNMLAKSPEMELRLANEAKNIGATTLQREENSLNPAVRKTASVQALISDHTRYARRSVDNADETYSRTRDYMTRAVEAEHSLGKMMVRANAKIWTTANLFSWVGKDFQEGVRNSMREFMTGTERRGGIYRDIREKDAPLGDRITALYRKYQGTKEAKIFDRLLEGSSRSRVRADFPLGEGKNARFKIGPNTKIYDESSANWQGRSAHPALERDLHSLPPELQSLYTDLGNFYEKRAKLISDQLIHDVLRSYPAAVQKDGTTSTVEDAIKRYQEGTHTEEDEKHYEEQGLTKDIRDAMRFGKDNAGYFPVYRNGRYVVYGHYHLEAGGFAKDINGGELPPSIREFASREEAQKYETTKNGGLTATMYMQHFIKESAGLPWEQVTAAEANSKASAQQAVRYRVEVQTKRMEMKEKLADAQRILKEMKEEGMRGVSEVLDRRELGPHGQGRLMGSHVAAVERRLNSREDLSPQAKAEAVEMLHETMMASMSQNKMAQHFMKRYNVQGGEFSHPRAYDDYSHTSAVWLANAQSRPTIDSALKRMAEIAQEKEGAPNAYRMSVIVNEMNHRAGLSDRMAMNTELPRWVQKVMNWNFMRYLAAPAHLLMHMVHVPTFVAPYLGSKYGFGTGYRALGTAYRDLGGFWPSFNQALLSGGKIVASAYVKDLQKQLEWEHGRNTLDGLTSNLKDRNELRLFKELSDDNHIHPNTGMDVIAGRDLGPDERLNRFMREITGAPDTINRSVTALATFRLEMAKSGGNVEKSILAAKEALEFTQGQMSMSNAAPWMRAAWVRPFMQFRQFPMQITWMIGKTIYNMIKNEEPGVRGEAFKFAAGVLGTVALMTGVNGMPTEMFKVAALLGASLGITKMPSEYDAEVQEKLAEWFGPGVANVMMNGLPALMGPVAPYIPHRAGMSSLWTFGEPSSDKPDDLWNWIRETVGGTPFSALKDGMDSLRALERGDYVEAVAGIAPSWGAHIIKGWQLAEEGKPTRRGQEGLPPQGILAALPEFFGFTSQVRANYFMAQHVFVEQQTRLRNDRSAALAEANSARNEGEGMMAVARWNEAHPEHPIRPAEIRQSRKKLLGEEAFGFRLNKYNKDSAERLKLIYGVSP